MGQVWVVMPLVASRFTAVAFFCCVVSLFVVVYVIFLFIAFAPVIREPLTAASRHRQRGRKEAPHVENQENPRPMLRRFFRTLAACPSFQLLST